MSSTNYQTTEYVYGVTTSSSDLNSLALLASVKYPDPTTGAASGASGTVESFTYDRTGKRKKYTDRNGSVHEYSFDKLGRLTNDAVTTLATGVNGDVRRLVYAYDVKGRLDTASSYDAATGGTLKNQVKRAYNDLGQLFKEYQAHSGAVNTGTTPFVGYAYSEMPGGANHSRPVSMTYPNGRILRYEYSSGTDAELNRLSFLADDSSGSVGTHLEEYTYLGASTVVTRAHPQPGVDLTYVKQGSESATDGGDDYTGIDRFGRVIDQRWIKPSGGTHVDRFKYGYDRNSSRLFKENVVQSSNSELYHVNGASGGYDTLNRLIDFRRGTLSDTNSDSVPDTVSTATRTQGWTLDALGNWSSLNTDGTSVTRTHDKQNRLTAVASTSLTFDDNGNLRTDNTTTWTNTYDAWNRRVRQAPPTGARHIVTYAFDALGRRIKRTNNGATLAFYYTASWQVAQDGSGTTFVWSPVYVDAVVARDRNTDANASTGSYGWGADERLYATADANFNVTALTDASGAATERFQYDPYGNPSFLTGSWAADADGFSDAFWPLLHQGGWYDNVGATGPSFYHFRNRDYSPTLGRWLQHDWNFADGVNLYQYVRDNPGSWIDPEGTDSEENCMQYATNIGNMFSLNAALAAGTLSPGFATQTLKDPESEYKHYFDHPTVFASVIDSFLGATGRPLTGPNDQCGKCDTDIKAKRGRKVCLYIYFHVPAWKYDMHWIVQENNGGWSGKEGQGDIKFTSPEAQENGTLGWFRKKRVGCWCIVGEPVRRLLDSSESSGA